MFAAVHFSGEKNLEIINVKKMKSTQNTKPVNDIVVSDKVFVPYKTMQIDDAGKEKVVQQDYSGIVAFLNKEKSEVSKFLESCGIEQVINSINNGSISDFVNKYTCDKSSGKGQKRKSKKTEKMSLLIEENQAEEVDTDEIVDKPKKKKTVNLQDSPSKHTRSKQTSSTASAASVAATTQKMQAVEYFKKKKRMQKQQENEPGDEQPHQEKEETLPEKEHPRLEKEQLQQKNLQPTPENVESQPACVQLRPEDLRPQPEKNQSDIVQPRSEDIQSRLEKKQSDNVQPRFEKKQSDNVQSWSEDVQPRLEKKQSDNVQPRLEKKQSDNVWPRSEDIQSRLEKKQSDNVQPRLEKKQSDNVQPRSEDVQSRLEKKQSDNVQLRSEEVQPQLEKKQSDNVQPWSEDVRPPHENLRPHPETLNHNLQNVQFQQQQPFYNQQPFFNQLMTYQQAQPFQNPQQIQRQQTIWNGEESSLSGVIASGFETLYGSSATKCHDCDKSRNRIRELEEENEKLKYECEKLKECSGSNLLNDLKGIIQLYDKEDTSFNNSEQFFQSLNTSASQEFSRSSTPEPLTPTTQCSRASTPASFSRASTQASFSRASTPALTSASTSARDVEEALEGHSNFFEPGENKVKLVEGGNVYIDSIKFKAMKNSCKGNPSRLVRELLSYFFTNDFLSTHSATGQKSPKPALPAAVVQPIREYCASTFRMTNHATNNIINRKCLDVNKKKLQKN